MSRFKVSVVELHPDLRVDSDAWRALAESCSAEAPDLLLLNEMPFGPWLAAESCFDATLWKQSLKAHDEGLAKLEELGAKQVASSRPHELNGERVNQAFVWSQDGLAPIHTKQFFPNEEGYYEARWFDSGERHFRLASVGEGLRVGFLLCTELMFNEHARRYGRNDADLILVPRAVGAASLSRWLVAMKMAAVVSGCYVLSSNRGGVNSSGQRFGGKGWIIDPDAELVAQTSPISSLVSLEIDLDFVRKAQSQYPCYVAE